MTGYFGDGQMPRRWSGLAPVLPPQRTSGAVPVPIPPHPPLQSGGWYRSLVRREVLGPGRPYPMDFAGRKSIATALALTAFFGPVGLCYVSTVTGLIATVLAVIVLAISGAGLGPLVVVWPLAMVWAAAAAGAWRVVTRWWSDREH